MTDFFGADADFVVALCDPGDRVKADCPCGFTYEGLFSDLPGHDCPQEVYRYGRTLAVQQTSRELMNLAEAMAHQFSLRIDTLVAEAIRKADGEWVDQVPFSTSPAAPDDPA